MKIAILLSCLVASAWGCGKTLEGVSGSFNSPDYPSDYASLLDCVWTVSVPSGNIELVFTDFALEVDPSCSYDSLEIRDGSSTGRIMGTFCGSDKPTGIVASGRTIILHLKTDGSVNAKGFAVSWKVSSSEATTPSPDSGCGGDRTGSSGTVSSPNYPLAYPANSNCVWTVSIPAGRLVLKFSHLDIEESNGECPYDSLKIYDGASNAVISTLCGKGNPTIEAPSHSVRIEFNSDDSVHQTGFSFTWSRLTCESKGLDCVAGNEACTGGTIKKDMFCEDDKVCCEPPFDQGDCGVIAPKPALIGGSSRIVGGKEAGRHSWPWQVSLRTTSSSFHFCGGSVLDATWIVTAAHCVDGDTPTGLKITTGEHNKTGSSGRELDHAVEKIIMHEGYNGNGAGFPNDIALLKLSSPLVMDDYRKPICLADTDEDFYGDYNCYITGWGRTLETADEDVLNELDVSVWDQDVCTNVWGSSYINDGHVCLGTGDTGACNGDSGGPLACQKTRDGVTRWVLAGVTSWGRSGCQTAGYPSVYSRVSYFRSWLVSTIRANDKPDNS